MSFMKDYQLKKHIEKHFKDHPDEVSKMNKDTFWLKRQNIDKYEKIPCNNARLNRVMSHVFKENAEQLLWVPPSFPYYKPQGVYKNAENFSKTLVFSSWEMVPRMIAGMISYEAERKTIGKLAKSTSVRPHYFYRDDENNNKINENNMSKIVLNEKDLMALVNESVKKVINEAVQNGELDEGWLGNIGRGFKGAFGGDVNKVASAVRTGVDKAKTMGSNAYNAVKNAGQKVAGAAKDAYGAVQTGVNQRVNAFKANYAAGQNADKINNVISTLRELQQNGVISGAKTNATIKELERLLQMGMKGMRGRATQVSNRIGKEEE
jgi:hypothetical protein